MLWPLSRAPENARKPMSIMPPSPPIATTVTSSFPCASRASLTPDATDAAFSKVTCIHGTFQDVRGYFVVVTSRHPVALQMTTFLPSAFNICLAAIAAPHPAQVVCPGARRSSLYLSFISFSFSAEMCLSITLIISSLRFAFDNSEASLFSESASPAHLEISPLLM